MCFRVVHVVQFRPCFRVVHVVQFRPKVLLPPTVGVKEFWGGGTNSRLKDNGGEGERQV